MQRVWLSSILVLNYWQHDGIVAETVDMSGQGFTIVPQNINPDVTKLNLDDNQIEIINIFSFRSYNNLIQLSMENNSLKAIGENTFGYNPLLQILDFHDNHLVNLPTMLGSNISIITRLDLQGAFSSTKNMSGLQEPYFRQFPNLNVLLIGYNILEPFNFSILPPSLRYLYISACGLTDFPNASHFTPSLKRLYANDNHYTDIPRENIGSLSRLRYLSANGNRLSVMPDVSGLFSLLELNLNKNHITSIPENTLTGLKNLRLLSIKDNDLHHISDMSHLFGLKSLSLDENQLNTIPDLYDLPLTKLTLHGNPLVCNQSLCWIRMMSLMNRTLQIGEVYCDYPGEENTSLLMGVHPADIHCYTGECMNKKNKTTYVKSLLELSWKWIAIHFIFLASTRSWNSG